MAFSQLTLDGDKHMASITFKDSYAGPLLHPTAFNSQFGLFNPFSTIGGEAVLAGRIKIPWYSWKKHVNLVEVKQL